MTSHVQTHWDGIYQRSHRVWSQRPNPDLERVIRYSECGGTALDLGAGEGANARFLAERGFAVEALDISGVAVSRINELADSLNLKISAKTSDVCLMSVAAAQYNLVVMDMLLPFLTRTQQVELFSKIMLGLSPDGILYVRTFSPSDPSYSPIPESNSSTFNTLDELRVLIGPLRILSTTEDFWLDNTHGEPHYHGTVSLIGKNIRASSSVG